MAIEYLVLEAMRMIQQNNPEQAVRSRYGQDAYAEAVKRLQDRPNPPDLSTAQFHAKQAAEKRAFFQRRAANGQKAHKASQQDHNCIVSSIFATIDAGNKPAVPSILRTYGEEQNRPPEWAERVATQKRPKRMGKTLAAYSEHSVIQELKEGRMFTQTHKSALQNSTYSGLAELLFSGSQSVREKRAMQKRVDAMEAELASVRAEAARANARLDLKDAGKDWKEAARAILQTQPNLSNRALAARVGKNEKSIRNYLKEIKG